MVMSSQSASYSPGRLDRLKCGEEKVTNPGPGVIETEVT
jgi:hypothetical protein